MNWLIDLFTGNSVAHTVIILALVISAGIMLGKIKIAGISIGMTPVLFVGIAVSHFGFGIDGNVSHFVKEFGLILFVYAVGLQVGPGFFSSLKKGGIKFNMLASAIVFTGVLVTVTLKYVTGLPISTMVGILSGAVTNTPGLGAAQETYNSMNGAGDPTIALGYAVAYPLGVLGIIFSIISVKYIFRINLDKEAEDLKSASEDKSDYAQAYSLDIENPAVFGKKISEVSALLNMNFVISRVLKKTGELVSASFDTVLNEADKILLISAPKNIDTIEAFIGKANNMKREDWTKLDSVLVHRQIVVTNSDVNGKKLKQLRLRSNHGVNVTRVNRAGVDLIADADLQLQMGDMLTVVGSENSINSTVKIIGNQVKKLYEPNLVTIFAGIFMGVLLGSIPFVFPGIPQPIKLGLAGGPLIVAILMSVFGPKLKLVTYTTQSANLMIREIGICLFLACVGLEAGEKFVETIVHGGGIKWIGLGVIITVVPLVLVGSIGRGIFKLNYFTLMGLMAGSTTDPPALSYASSTAGNDAPAVSYATVYPLTMFLRVLTAQLLILLF